MFEDDVETPHELYDFFSAALGHEQQDAMEVRQDRLDVELHYDIEAALWDGEYVKASPFEEVSAFGDATDSQAMDLDAFTYFWVQVLHVVICLCTDLCYTTLKSVSTISNVPSSHKCFRLFQLFSTSHLVSC